VCEPGWVAEKQCRARACLAYTTAHAKQASHVGGNQGARPAVPPQLQGVQCRQRLPHCPAHRHPPEAMGGGTAVSLPGGMSRPNRAGGGQAAVSACGAWLHLRSRQLSAASLCAPEQPMSEPACLSATCCPAWEATVAFTMQQRRLAGYTAWFGNFKGTRKGKDEHRGEGMGMQSARGAIM